MKVLFLSATILLSLFASSAYGQTVQTCKVIDDHIPVGQRFEIDLEPGYITGDTVGSQVNVRTGPGSEYEASAYGLVGDSVQIIGQAFSTNCETWIQVRFPISRHVGWIHSNFIGLYYSRGWWT